MRRLAGAIAVAWALLAAAAAHGAAADTPCPAVDYVAALQQAGADLGATPPDTAGAVTLLEQLGRSDAAAQRTLGPVLNRLDAAPPDIDAARRRISAMTAMLSLPAGSTCNADQRPARAELNQVYASPVFANLDRKPPRPNPLSQFLSWLSSLLAGLMAHLGSAGSIALGAALLAAVLAFAAWRLRGILAPSAAGVAAEPREETIDPDRLWSMAEASARQGDHRQAVRRAFRSALLSVAVRGRLMVDPSWTTHELLAATRADAALLTALAPAAASFDRAWYSGAAVTASDWDEARARCEAVRSLARSRPRAPSS